MDNALVSIIVPVYNTAEYIEECIQSILSQSYKNTELILVNDGSTDGSGEICKKYEHLQNVIYIENHHHGVVEARKQGVERACGEWIMFVDSDDMLLEYGIEHLIRLNQLYPNSNIVIGDQQGDKGLLTLSSFLEWKDFLYRIYANAGVPGALWAKLFRRQLIIDSKDAFRYNFERGEDVIMNLIIAKTNREIIPICKDVVYYYRRRITSVTYTKPYTFDYCLKICEITDSIVDGFFPKKEMLRGGINRRLYYYNKVISENDYQGNRNHPFVKEIIKRLNEAKVIRLSDRLLLFGSNKTTIKACLFFSKFIKRIESPKLIVMDLNRACRR